MRKNKNTKTFAKFKDEHYGKIGTHKRDRLERDSEVFRLGVMLQQARIEKGMTQDDLAAKIGTDKSYISKVENDLKNVRIATLQKIVEVGLGGHLELSIQL